MSTVTVVATNAKARKQKSAARGADQGADASPVASPQPAPGILAALGLYGLEEVEPAILAALLTEDPLLLIGPHGTGKSMLLERLAEALGLCFRHYNASLICFDDLIGFPVPEPGSATLRYLQTPATIWDAEAVFFDEVSRCKPDVQNKLFSIIHERKVQGLRLEKLRYRWSAMNPPASSSGRDNYSGSQPLDSALADRYAFVVQMPDWNALGEAAQERILEAAGQPADNTAGKRLKELLDHARPRWSAARQELEPLLVEYVRHVAVVLQEAQIRLSVRRLVMLMRNIAAVHAVRQSADENADAFESFRLALCCSIPHLAEGVPLLQTKLSALHAKAWKNVSGGKALVLTRVLSEEDPVIRATLAARSDALDLQQRSVIIADCMQGLPDGARHALAAWLMEHDFAGRLVAAVAEKVAGDYAMIAVPGQGEFTTYGEGGHTLARYIAAKVAECGMDAASQAIGHLLTTLFARDQLKSEAHVDRICRSWRETREKLRQIARQVN